MRLNGLILYTILFLSGVAGLGYEIVWTRMLALGLGHEIVAVLSVVSAFFCGLAAGSWLIERMGICRTYPGLAYALLEAAIGLWSLALIVLIPPANFLMAGAMGPEPSFFQHWTVSFLGPFLLLFPATFAMGGTLPVMNRFLALRGRRDGVGGLYAANTLGAMCGTLLSALVIMPWLGFKGTLLFLAVLNLVCAASAALIAAGVQRKAADDRTPALGTDAIPSPLLSFILFATGLLGIGYEVLVIRMLSQVLEDTVYSFASTLTVYLLGTAGGAALYQRFVPRIPFRKGALFLLTGLASLCILGALLLSHSNDVYTILRAGLGAGTARAILGEMMLAVMVFLLPTLAMGALFSHLAQESAGRTSGLGGALCVNTLGASVSPLIFGIFLLPSLGAKFSFAMVSLGYLLLVPLAGGRRYRPALVPIAIGFAFVLLPNPLRLVTLGPGERILEYREGVMASVAVVRDGLGEIHLKVNNRFQMGGTSSVFSDRRQGHIPLLLHPAPTTALFLGMGTGATLAASLDHPGVQAEGVELVPEIVPLLHHFRKATGDLTRHPRVKMVVADARRYVNASGKRYDVIVADLFHPARDGAGWLYTAEHFSAIRSRLAEGGVFCQWLPLYQMDLETLRTITRTFLAIFPEGSAYLAHYSLKAPIIGLVGTTGRRTYSARWLDERVRDETLVKRLQELRLHTDFNLFGCFVGRSEDLKRFAGPGSLNTDNQPLVTFRAPSFAYSNREPAYSRLLSFLGNLSPATGQVLLPPRNAEETERHSRLAAYWAARNQFLKAGVGVKETDDVRQLVRQAREPLLAVVRQSRDFDAAYNPLLAMARQLSRTDVNAAEQLLLDLEKANPYRAEARFLRTSIRQ
jgi:spermidine synthase